MGDIHPSGNPHYWLNPKNGLIIAERIRDRLLLLDPENSARYRENFQGFERRLSGRINSWQQAVQPLREKKVVTHHKTFSYFVDWTGLQVDGLVEPKPGIPPNQSHILSLIQLIQDKKIPLIITENYYDPKPSRELARRTGARVLILPTSVGGEPGMTTYEGLFEFLIAKLQESL
jgi:zinc/manganese transport system substrate-binding protein